jgi:catechol 2,3-dioxygenase
MSNREQGSVEPTEAAPRPIDPGVRIGHVHLRTADIDRVKAFYCGVLGFDVVAEARGIPGWGTTGDILFVSAGGYHHHLGLNTWAGVGAPPPPPEAAGLRHFVVALPDADALEQVVARVRAANIATEQTEASLLLRDPSQNSVVLTMRKV